MPKIKITFFTSKKKNIKLTTFINNYLECFKNNLIKESK